MMDRSYIDANLLTGTVPSELGRLTALTELGLSFNMLTDVIPSELGRLTGLYSLYDWIQCDVGEDVASQVSRPQHVEWRIAE